MVLKTKNSTLEKTGFTLYLTLSSINILVQGRRQKIFRGDGDNRKKLFRGSYSNRFYL